MNRFILALCGLPASGKSTLADAIKMALNSNVEIVRTDDWRNDAYYTDWKPEKEKPVREAALAKVERLVSEGKSVIHDDTNYYSSMRHELLKIAIAGRAGFAIIHITTPLTTALKWNREKSDSRIPDSVIEDIFEKFDNPGKRYLWDNSNLEVDLESQELTEVVPEIIEILEGLKPALTPESDVISNSDFNEIDTETRLIVSRFLEEHPELRRNREVSVVRRSVLREANERSFNIERVRETLVEKLNKLL